MLRRKTKCVASLVSAAAMSLALAGPASAHHPLVEVDLLNGNQVAVPIQAAANICNVNVEVLTADLFSGDQKAKCVNDLDQEVELIKDHRDKDKGKDKGKK